MNKNGRNPNTSRSTANFLIGLVAALSLSLIAFEWRSEQIAFNPDTTWESQESWELETPPITRPKAPELPQPFPTIDRSMPPVPGIEPIITPDPAPSTDPSSKRNTDPTDLRFDEEPVVDSFPLPPKHFAEVSPTFPGGEKALYSYLQGTLHYPEQAKLHNVSGKVYVEFIVGTDGAIRDAKVVGGIPGNDMGCHDEALRVVEQMPNWIPGMQGDRTVAVIHRMAINFILQ